MNSQVISLLPPQAQNFAVLTTPLDVSNKPNGVSLPTGRSLDGSPANAVVVPKQRQVVSQNELAGMLDQVNQSYDPFEIEARATMSKHGQRVIVTLRNTRTGEIIRKIPPEEFSSQFEGSNGGLGLWINRKV